MKTRPTPFFRLSAPLLLWSLLPIFFAISCSAHLTDLKSISFSASPQVDAGSAPAPILAEVLMLIQLDYVAPNRLNPHEMLEESLAELARQIPEIQTNLELTAQGEQLVLSLGTRREAIAVPKLQTLDELNIILQHVAKIIASEGYKPRKWKRAEYAMVHGLLSKLDPHSVLLPKESYDEFEISTRGNFSGVGIQVGFYDNKLTIIAPIEGTPASKAGLRALDRIVRIGEEATESLSLTDTINRLRGEAGTKLILYIMRDGFAEPQRFELVRDVIRVQSVESTDLTLDELQVRYVKIKNFQETTSADLTKALSSLEEIDGIVLDMRNNPGGLLDQAIKVSDLFLDEKKTIVSTVGSEGQSQSFESHWALGNGKLMELPSIVLINNGSASASEIVAAALKNNNRALLLGEQSFGKGSVQMLSGLQDQSALKLTIAKYLTPGNKSIQSVGVTPDVLVYPVSLGQGRFQLLHQEQQKEKDLERTFEEWGDTPDKPLINLAYFRDESKELDEFSAPLNERLEQDFFVHFAQKILEQQHKGQSTLKEAALAVQQKLAEEQDLLIVEKLKSHGIDWKNGPQVSEPSLDIQIESMWRKSDDAEWAPVPQHVPSGSVVRFRVSAKNKGSQPIHRMLVVTRSENDVFDLREMPLGHLEPGKRVTKEIVVPIPENIAEQVNAIDFEFQDQGKKVWTTKRIFVHALAAPQPQFQMTLKILDDGQFGSKGNGDFQIQAGETIALSMEIINEGNATSENTIALLKKNGDPGVVLIKDRIDLEALETGKSVSAVLVFKVLSEQLANLDGLFIEIRDEGWVDTRLIYPFSNEHLVQNQEILQIPQMEISVLNPRGTPVSGVTHLKNLTLQGLAKDDGQVKDVFIFLNNRKIFFQAPQEKTNQQSFPFKTEIKLEEGQNNIHIFARDQHNLVASKQIQFWYDPS